MTQQQPQQMQDIDLTFKLSFIDSVIKTLDEVWIDWICEGRPTYFGMYYYEVKRKGYVIL